MKGLLIASALAFAILVPPSVSAQADPPVIPNLRLVWEVGQGEDEVTFRSIAHLAIGESGEVFAADAGNGQVIVLGPAGRYLMTLGRRGSGPGEFARPMYIRVDSIIEVFDPPQNRVVRFAPDGEVIETRRIADVGDRTLTTLLEVGGGARILATLPMFVPGRPTHDPNVSLLHLGPDRSTVDTLIVYRSGGGMYYSASRITPWGVDVTPMGEGGAWVMIGDSAVVVADGVTGEIRWYAVGQRAELLRRASAGASVRRTGPADERAFLSRVREGGRTVPPDALVDLPAVWSVATAMVAGPDGTLWIRQADPGRRNLWRVVDPAGDVRTMELPAGFRLFAIRDDGLFGVRTTALDEELVTVYRWER